MGFFDTLNQARNQVFVVAFVCFLCPGMFNALNSLATDNVTQALLKYQQNAALYGCFALMGLLAGGLNNLVGPRILLSLGGITYAIYAAAQYTVHRTQYTDDAGNVVVPAATGNFSVASGAILGLGAGMLWAAQGQIVMTYPTESRKGTFFAYFWVIFNCGAVLGSIIALGQSWGSGKAPASDSIYLVFIVLMACGSFVALLIASPASVIREDQTQVAVAPTNVGKELIEIVKLFMNPAMLVLFIPSASSNWFYSYQFGYFQPYFDARTGSLNNVFYWAAQMAGSWVLGNMFLDNVKYGRIMRAWTGCAIMAGSTLIFWGGGAAFQYVWNDRTPHAADATDGGSWFGAFVLYICYGFYDAFFQTYSYWLMGALSNDSEKLSRYAGFYKGVQSAAAALSWGFGSLYPDWNGIQWYWASVVPMLASCVAFAVFVHLFVKETSEDGDKDSTTELGEEEPKFTIAH